MTIHSTSSPAGPPIEESQFGPYRLVTQKPSDRKTLREHWDQLLFVVPSFQRLVADVYSPKLRLTGAQDLIKRSVYEDVAWNAFHNLTHHAARWRATTLAYVFRAIGASAHSPFFIIACLVHPLLVFVRRSNLLKLREKTYKQDIIMGDIGQYILRGFRNAVSLLGDIDILMPHENFYKHERRTYWSVLVRLAKEIPMVYYAVNAILNPTQFSFSTITTPQKIDSQLGWSLVSLIRAKQRFVRYYGSQVRAIYNMENVHRDATYGEAAITGAIRRWYLCHW
ncbi:ABC transporter ATP-binding protein [Mycena kentingensis (nom. inval.)]|nr:ABC transporter ATP-binding protein [Mycena kentingensis (nom. inval.)]